jgi:argininosuccinate lyase
MMPQKRNPDLAELLRGWCATAIADLNGMLALLKGLPLAYDRDLQTDKEFLFRTGGRIGQILEAARALVSVIVFDAQKLADAATRGASWATDMAEALVGRGVPFREAHEASGRLVAELEGRSMRLEDADAELLGRIHPKFEAADTDLADPLASIRRRTSRGGPSPSEVAKQIATLREIAAELRS